MSNIPFIETPIKPVKSGGKVKPMTNKTQTSEAPKASRKYQKSRGEHAKDVLIAVLVTAVVAFVAGTRYQANQQEQVNQAVKAAQATATVEATKK